MFRTGFGVGAEDLRRATRPGQAVVAVVVGNPMVAVADKLMVAVVGRRMVAAARIAMAGKKIADM